jgi:hypothetical protein
LSWRNFRDKIEETEGAASAPVDDVSSPQTEPDGDLQPATSRVFTLRPNDPQN